MILMHFKLEKHGCRILFKSRIRKEYDFCPSGFLTQMRLYVEDFWANLELLKFMFPLYLVRGFPRLFVKLIIPLKVKKKLFIYLAALSLSCNTRDLHCNMCL